MALNIRQFNDLRSVQTSGSGVTKAKKMANLYIQTHTNDAGKVVDPAVYEHAINTYLAPFAGDVDADNQIAAYVNDMKQLSVKSTTNKQTVGQFKMDERDIFFVTPRSAYRDDIMNDLPTMVSQIAEELAIHNLEVLRAIDIAEANGDSTTELENYLFDSQKRMDTMLELNNDILTGEISAGQAFKEVGIYIDTDNDDGTVRGVGIMPVDNLPLGISPQDFKRIEASSELGGGFLAVYGSATTNEYGESEVNIGGNKWVGTGNQPLRFSKRDSVDPSLKANDGGFNLGSISMKAPAIKPNRFFKGYVGFDEENNPKEQYFYADANGSLYEVSDEDVASLKNDPTQGSFIKNATRVDSQFARGVTKSQVLKPYNSVPSDQLPVAPAPMTTSQPEEQKGFFSRAASAIGGLFKRPEGEPVQSGTQTSTPAFFQNRTNAPSAIKTPQQVGGAASPLDIIGQGASFFKSK